MPAGMGIPGGDVCPVVGNQGQAAATCKRSEVRNADPAVKKIRRGE